MADETVKNTTTPTAPTTTVNADQDNEEDVIEISPGFIGVLQILANKISKKGAIIGLAMVLIYLLSATPAAPQLVFSVAVLSGLSIFYSTLQWILDRKQQRTKLKIVERTQDTTLLKTNKKNTTTG